MLSPSNRISDLSPLKQSTFFSGGLAEYDGIYDSYNGVSSVSPVRLGNLIFQSGLEIQKSVSKLRADSRAIPMAEQLTYSNSKGD